VAGADGMGVVVVVPAFASADEGDPPVVAGVVAGFKTAGAPEVGSGVDEPGGVEAEGDAHEGAPEKHTHGRLPSAGEPAEAEEERAAEDEGNPVIFAEGDEEGIALEVGDVAGKGFSLCVLRVAPDEPAEVSPPGALAGSVGVAFLVTVLVMNAVSGYPEDGPALKGERGADGHGMLNPFGNLVAAMSEQAVITHADADVDGDDIQGEHDGEALPGEEEEGGDGAEMEGNDDGEGEPVDAFAGGGGAAHAHGLARVG